MPCVLCGTPLAEARIVVDPVASSGGARTEEARKHLEETLQWQREGQVRPADLKATEEAVAALG